jgi:RHS repeat-associated protein
VKFIHDGENVLLETDSGGTTQAAYTLEPQAYGNLISQRRSGATAWHLFDALGSTERLTNNAETTLVTYLHKAFGITSVLSGSSPNRCTWLGRLGYRWEPDSQQYDVRRRRLNPTRGRWLTQDTVYESRNPYAYASNSPLARLDPSGLWVADDHFNQTLRIASRVFEVVNGQIRGFSTDAARIIASGSREVDMVPQFWGGGFHFDWQWCGEPRMTRGGVAQIYFSIAIYYGKVARECPRSWRNLGYALHPWQDDSAHGNATPCEHTYRALRRIQFFEEEGMAHIRPRANPVPEDNRWLDYRWVDTHWDVLTAIPGKYWRGPKVVNERCACTSQCFIRVFNPLNWHGESRISNRYISIRFAEMRKATRKHLQKYLQALPPCNPCYKALGYTS